MKHSSIALVLLVATASFATDWVKHYHDRVALFAAENKKLDANTKYVVLVGDSLTEGWTAGRIKKFLPTIAERTLNRGIVSDGCGVNDRGVLHRMEASFFDCKATHAFLLIGVNDIGKDGRGIDKASQALEKVVKAVKEKKGGPELTLITCTPGAKKHKELNPSIMKWNEKVTALAKENGVSLIDLHSLVVDKEGALPEELTSDGLHWKDGVYEKLGAEIEKTLAKKKKP